MMYKRGQQGLVKIDGNNPSRWGYRHTTNMQYIKTVAASSSSNTLSTVSYFLLHYPYNNWPTLQSGWGCDSTYHFSEVKPHEADKAGGC
eukprot:4643825-Ditylum_brightwellii.AAC.1